MIEVAAAVIQRGDRVLVARRARPAALAGKWEFPGGKLEPGETGQEALAREIVEELDLRVEAGVALGRSHRVPSGEDAPDLRLTAYAARALDPSHEPRLVDGTHDSLRWVTAEELPTLDLAPLDVPLVQGAVAFLADPDDHLR
ncbi:MAG: NUDIX domain-containing protein [Planctomycetota bacterium]|nr:NUDIX domain-containing protein [Planctomycetota bacterium]